jgi:DNA-binding MarR family transcriptional regulator
LQRERDELGLAAWSLLLRTHAALVPRLGRELERRCHLPLAWYDVLLELNSAPRRRLRMQELGNRVVLSRTRVSRIVDELAAAEMARREPDPDDRRGSYAVLTDSGRQALRDAAPVYLAGIAEHFTSRLSDDELRYLRSALTRVVDPLETAHRQPPPERPIPASSTSPATSSPTAITTTT